MSSKRQHTIERLRGYAVGLCVATAVFGTSACALTSKADLVEIRYFSPEQVRPRINGADATAEKASTPPGSAANGAIELRLGRISSGSNLRERIAFRDAAYELGYYEDWRWTERPETFVRRELGRALFEEHGLQRVLSGSAPTLEVEVIAFDDLRLQTGRAARVQLKVILYEDRGVIYEETVTVDRPVSGAKPKIEDVVAAMASALDAAADEVSVKAQKALAAKRAAAAAAAPAAAPTTTTTTTAIQATTTTTKK